MIGLIQRVNKATVKVNNKSVGSINKGLLLFLGLEKGDSKLEIEKLAKKVANIRIFEDENKKMNKSLFQLAQENHAVKLLVVSQFTLVADTKKGNRPGFSNSAPPDISESLYNDFIHHFTEHYCECESGEFGANMQVELINDGPATFHLQV
jgi:D-tyrosyl-tRNA(Tyr) deacylase